MKKTIEQSSLRLRVWCCLGMAAFFAFPILAMAQEDGYSFRLSNFSFEIYGGWAKPDLKELNFLADYENFYRNYLYVKRFDYLHTQNGDAYTSSTRFSDDNEIRRLKSGRSLGFRLRYAVSPTLGICVGLRKMTGSQTSKTGIMVDVRDGRGNSPSGPDLLSYEYRNTGFSLSFESWNPELSVRFGWDIARLFRVDAFIAGGPIFADCRVATERLAVFTNASGNRMESYFIEEMNGHAKSVFGELGARLLIKPFKSLSFFVEGAYAFIEAGDVLGSGSRRFESGIPGYDTFVDTWDGQWMVYHAVTLEPWEKAVGMIARNGLQYGHAEYFDKIYLQYVSPFTLELTGFQLRVGLTVSLF